MQGGLRLKRKARLKLSDWPRFSIQSYIDGDAQASRRHLRKAQVKCLAIQDQSIQVS